VAHLTEAKRSEAAGAPRESAEKRPRRKHVCALRERERERERERA
jgi:hypothetical protein